jgi:hypothetical protein
MLEIVSSKNVARMIAFSLLILSACGGDDDAGPSYEELLAGSEKKIWHWYSSTLYGNETIEECFRDDAFVFERNGNVTWRNVTTPCPNANELMKSTWKISPDGQSLRFFSGTYRVLSLTDSKMEIQFPRRGENYIDVFLKD